jgi:hypothetical protein
MDKTESTIRQHAKIVTMDTSADFKRLRKMQNAGLIHVENVNLENKVKRISATHLTVGILGVAKLPFRLGPYNVFEKILSMIGKQNIQDAMILEAHINSGNDYFVTNNVDDFIDNSKRESLEKTFPGLRILKIDELENLIYGK